jgi:hypothetical protein
MADDPALEPETATSQGVENRSMEKVCTDIVISWLRNHWVDQRCPVCESDDWAVGSPAEVQLYWGTDGPANRHFPFVPVWCGKCGYTLLFHAGHMGLTPQMLHEWIDAVVEAENQKR